MSKSMDQLNSLEQVICARNVVFIFTLVTGKAVMTMDVNQSRIVVHIPPSGVREILIKSKPSVVGQRVV